MTELLDRGDLDRLIAVLHDSGYQVIAPTVQGSAIVYDRIQSAADLPRGLTEEQAPGRYRVVARGDERWFGFQVGPHSWKQSLFVPRETLVRIRTNRSSPSFEATADDGPALAFLAVRACDLAAIAIQDRIMTGGPFVDGRYQARRDRCLIIAVSCTEAGNLCFCDSMGTGPRADGDWDLHFIETDDGLLIEARGQRGGDILERLPTRPANPSECTEADRAVDDCRSNMGRTLDTDLLPERLMGNLASPRWHEVAERCLACGNCTLACPTCFCFDIRDHSVVGEQGAERERHWDSCFTADHSTIHGGHFRPDIRTRYQQWLTHKLATWTSQFGTSGCVGCGRCIAWCPVGIDITEEATAIAAGPGPAQPLPAYQPARPGTSDGQVATAVRVIERSVELPDVVTLTVEAPAGHIHRPGQFHMLSIPAVGDVPISISGTGAGTFGIEHTIRAVGAVSSALCELGPGSWLGMRGPFGSAWPLDHAVGHPVVVIAGGLGLAPLRGALRVMASEPDRYPAVRLMYGARSPDDILYHRELLAWVRGGPIRAHVTVDRGNPQWKGNVGPVTQLIRRKHTPADGMYLLCGPEVMMKFSLMTLLDHGVPAERIYLSMERNMKCAAGMCGRCQYGPYFVCKDGPVFRYDQIDFLFGKDGF